MWVPVDRRGCFKKRGRLVHGCDASTRLRIHSEGMSPWTATALGGMVAGFACRRSRAMCVLPSASTNHALDATRQNNHRAEQGSRAAGQRVERGRGTVRTSVQEGPLLCTDALWPLRRRIDTCMHAKHVANTLHSDKLYLLYPLRHRFQLPPP